MAAIIYQTEAEAQARAEYLTRLWEESGGDEGWRAYATYSVSAGGWVVCRRRDLPGTCT
jgi:hypothetical protein